MSSKLMPPNRSSGEKPGDPGIAAGIVLGPLLRIAQDRVGLGDLLEAVACAWLLVAIGVILERELPKRILDRLYVGVARDAEHLVIVARFGQGYRLALSRPAGCFAVLGVDHAAAWTEPVGRASPVGAPTSGRGCGPGCGAWA